MKKLPPILDACCGPRGFWFDKKNPLVLFADKREMRETTGTGKNERLRIVSPDVIHDFREMDYPTGHFEMVVFDPPHLFVGETSYTAKIYGALNRGTWKDDITRGFSECFRVLRAGGFLVFKWNESDILLSEILKCASYPPLFGHPSGKAQKTHWVIFQKPHPVTMDDPAFN